MIWSSNHRNGQIENISAETQLPKKKNEKLRMKIKQKKFKQNISVWIFQLIFKISIQSSKLHNFV